MGVRNRVGIRLPSGPPGYIGWRAPGLLEIPSQLHMVTYVAGSDWTREVERAALHGMLLLK